MEFTISEFLSLRLEDEKTVIYINGVPFLQCKYVLLTFTEDDESRIYKFNDVKSIDELAGLLDNSLEYPSRFEIPPQAEFWGHCSNLQAWYEHEYDTNLIHSNLAFPLLKKLSEAGDQLAVHVFKDEIAKRFLSCIPRTMIFLLENSYFEFLSVEEVSSLLRELQIKNDHVYQYFRPFFIYYRHISAHDLKEEIEHFDLESDMGKFRDVETEDYLSWARVDTINHLRSRLRAEKK